MSQTPAKTRFAPSPTGLIHLGNARTALFSALLARRLGGRFVLRIEDTDAERSRDEYVDALMQDLRWLGADWQEGPGCEADAGPYYQSRRGDTYADRYRRLEEGGHAYPCFCTAAELEISRKAQRSAGKAPRYSGKCAGLSADEAQAKREAGLEATLRFRVPAGRTIEFDDLVRGPQRFDAAEIGDFIIRRADGTPAFFFCNAVDDALMGITHVLRGEDHLTNTPRQLLILEALGLRAPAYGHISLIVGPDGTPLSKRHGSRSLQELRAAGYLAEAVANYLARLGHNYASDALEAIDALAAGFELARLGRAPARYDSAQLRYWQGEAVTRADADRLWAWMGPEVAQEVPDSAREAFIEAVRPNVVFPPDAAHWATRLFADPLHPSDAARAVIAEAGGAFFAAAAAALPGRADDFKAFSQAVKEATGAKGKGLFMPLRAALTGEVHGPEMGRVLPLIGEARALRRLEQAVSLT